MSMRALVGASETGHPNSDSVRTAIATDAPIFVKPLLDRDLQTHDGSRTIAPIRRTPGRALGGRTGLRTIRSAPHDVMPRPPSAQSHTAEDCASCSLPIQQLVAPLPAPCGD